MEKCKICGGEHDEITSWAVCIKSLGERQAQSEKAIRDLEDEIDSAPAAKAALTLPPSTPPPAKPK